MIEHLNLFCFSFERLVLEDFAFLLDITPEVY
jgi:hypothetical protein